MLKEVEQARREGRHAIALDGLQRLQHVLDIAPRHVGDLELAQGRHDVAVALLAIVSRRALRHPAPLDPARHIFAKEPRHPIGDGRRCGGILTAP